MENFEEIIRKNAIIAEILKVIIKKLGNGEIKNNIQSYYEYKKMREEKGVPLTDIEQAKLMHIAEQKDMEEENG